jgi:hypothetical protein
MRRAWTGAFRFRSRALGDYTEANFAKPWLR